MGLVNKNIYVLELCNVIRQKTRKANRSKFCCWHEPSWCFSGQMLHPGTAVMEGGADLRESQGRERDRVEAVCLGVIPDGKEG